MIYKAAITEIRRRIVAVEASTETEAKNRISDAWHNGELLRDENDFEGFEVYINGEADPCDKLFMVERKDW